jgi:hypothetical protein
VSDALDRWTRTPLTRREMIGASAAALVLPLLSARPLLALTEHAFAARFFTPAEFAMVDELSDLIIPTDEVSPGARVARVAGEIDRRIADSMDAEQKTRWRAGLRAVNDLAREMTGKPLMQATPEQRLAVLTRMAANESEPKTPVERFFGQLKRSTSRAYYSSKVGIHQDQHYKGNVYQNGEYAGLDPT